MSEVKHSPECQKQIDERKKAINEFMDKWPKCCPDCYGEGGRALPGSYWEPPVFDPCETCICEGKCARCGEKFDTEDDTKPCPHCGWNWAKNPDDICPPPSDCYGECIEEDNPDDIPDFE